MLDGHAVGIQSDEQDGPSGRDLEIRRAIGLDGDCAHNAFENKRAKPRSEVHSPAEINRLGQRFQNQQLLDLTRFDTFHVASVVDIGQDYPTRRFVLICPIDDQLFPPALDHRNRFVDVRLALVFQDRSKLARMCSQKKLFEGGNQKMIGADGRRVIVRSLPLRPLSYAMITSHVVRAILGLDGTDVSAMVGPAVSRRIDQQQLVGARDRLGFYVQRIMGLVAKIGGDVTSVGIHRPELVITHLGAVDILPSGIEYAPVRQNCGSIVMFEIHRKRANIASVSVASKKRSDLGHPASHPAFAPR